MLLNLSPPPPVTEDASGDPSKWRPPTAYTAYLEAHNQRQQPTTAPAGLTRDGSGGNGQDVGDGVPPPPQRPGTVAETGSGHKGDGGDSADILTVPDDGEEGRTASAAPAIVVPEGGPEGGGDGEVAPNAAATAPAEMQEAGSVAVSVKPGRKDPVPTFEGPGGGGPSRTASRSSQSSTGKGGAAGKVQGGSFRSSRRESDAGSAPGSFRGSRSRAGSVTGAAEIVKEGSRANSRPGSFTGSARGGGSSVGNNKAGSNSRAGGYKSGTPTPSDKSAAAPASNRGSKAGTPTAEVEAGASSNNAPEEQEEQKSEEGVAVQDDGQVQGESRVSGTLDISADTEATSRPSTAASSVQGEAIIESGASFKEPRPPSKPQSIAGGSRPVSARLSRPGSRASLAAGNGSRPNSSLGVE